ncbi:MAG: bifunctional folylpolyglutamate synthase/dihydrofolate synthase [Lawsonibacter sp.]|nr:bifunctional folylpolyglutamate synthase/dihydrofolate synthase [Lawsonibacter sp.]
MTEQEAVSLIHQRAWTGQPPGLARTRALLDRLGTPQTGMKFVHIAGSNGKGSTAAMLSGILTRAGLRTGLYTSPHLWDFRERFQVDGQPIPGEALAELTAQVLSAAREETEFELMTAIAMLWFRREGCELVVLETGLGGRLDSTNVIPPPEAAVLTTIGLEHTQQLGDTLPQIAREKAGILKPGSRAVLCRQDPAVMAVVEEVCRDGGIPLTCTAPETLEVLSSGLEGTAFTYRGRGPYRLSLLGEHQLQNAAAVLDAVQVLRARGWPIPEQAVQAGLAEARWPGRLELVRRAPDLLLDGAHNPPCTAALAQSLAALYPGKTFWFLTGVLEDKDYPSMAESLLPLARGFVTVTPDSPRALPARDLAAHLQRRGAQAVSAPSPQAGLEAVLARSGPETPVCAWGSLYLIGALRHLLGLC